MTNLPTVRAVSQSDLPAIKHIIDATQLFPSVYLDEMVKPFFEDENSDERWFVVSNDGIKGVAYCAPEKMTSGTWNLLLIAVDPSVQGRGIGRRLIQHVEQQLQSVEARVLLVETSGLAEFELTRRFYPKCGYRQVAVIPDYYDLGDDKVVFWKQLQGK